MCGLTTDEKGDKGGSEVVGCLSFQEDSGGVPAVAQWVKDPTAVVQVAVEVRIQSLAWHRGLRILSCSSCGVRHSCSSDSVTGPGTSMSWVGPLKKTRGSV